jgi:D-alanine-D-alanine ligase-like ATP-grasp enzyme
VLIEERCDGDDLRIVVIDHRVIAAVRFADRRRRRRRPHSVAELIDAQSRRRRRRDRRRVGHPRRRRKTAGMLAEQGSSLDSVPRRATRIEVCRTANLHTGGTIHDVTDHLHPSLADAAVSPVGRSTSPSPASTCWCPTSRGPTT